MNNNWTYNQYKLLRALFGGYLLFHFLWLLPWGVELLSSQGMIFDSSLSPYMRLFPNILILSDSPFIVSLLLGVGVIASIGLVIGKLDRYAALMLWYILTCLFDRNPLIGNPSLPYVGWLLIAHSCLPRPQILAHTWRMPRGIFLAAWVTMAIGYTYSGYTKLISPSWLDGSAISHILMNPLARSNLVTEFLNALPHPILQGFTWFALMLELLFAPLALFSRLRPWLWLSLLGMHIFLCSIIRFADLSMGMIILHLFTFNPAWIKARGHTIIVFYDGTCGLCHSFVQFTLSENVQQANITFAPLQGKTFQELKENQKIKTLPDSIVVYIPEEQRLLIKSRAVAHVFDSLGGIWGCIAYLIRLTPTTIADWGYDKVAKIRHQLFSKPNKACPLLPNEWKRHIISE